MEPCSFDESNGVLGKPDNMTDEECSPLSVYRDGTYVVSCWKLRKDELEQINKTGRVWLLINGVTMPPARLQIFSPFIPEIDS
jgi:hypothetical protein